ncbi:MAG: ribonuclease J [Mycoplasmataceae bacterium]|nr:ribonuclease J [Mycoplasmataceae bacterium]
MKDDKIASKEKAVDVPVKDTKNADNNNDSVTKRGLKYELPTYVGALGGLGEVGKNMYFVEEGNELWIIDSGVKFSDDPNLAIEGIIPNFDYLEKNQRKIRGLIVTHGHEDHIGSIPHLVQRINIPKIYAPKIALELIKKKISEKGARRVPMQLISNKYRIKSRNFEISFFNVNHSIPDSLGVEFKSANGTIVSTGDFKFDLTPVGQKTDFFKINNIGNEGVSILLADSTNALVPNFSTSESDVMVELEKIFKSNKSKRLILSTFASNVYRVETVVELAKKYNRKIAIFGWSMQKGFTISRKIKYIDIDDSMIVDEKEIKNVKDSELLIICTGSQGEENAALNKIADGKQKYVKAGKNDLFIFSSSPIPGNYRKVQMLHNKILRKGSSIVDNKFSSKVHTSGHGSKKENELMLSMLKPRYFFPVHGEHRMLLAHKESAVKLGMNPKNVFVLRNGSRIRLLNGIAKVDTPVPGDDVFVDGSDLLGQNIKVLSDRTQMTGNGVISIAVGVDSTTNTIIDGPKITSKGFVTIKDNKEFFTTMETKVKESLVKVFESKERITFSLLKNTIRETAEKEIFDRYKLSPIVIPVILKKENPNDIKEEQANKTKDKAKDKKTQTEKKK